MTVGGVEVVLVTVTVPFALVMMRIGADAVARVAVDDAVVVDAVVVDDVVAACVRRRLPRGGLAARVGLGVAAEVSVGVRIVVLVPVVVVGPAAN
jgi:hypothetical protein